MDSVKYKTIFISDVHLGSSNCNAEALLEFLKNFDSEILYLNGDIIDFWRMKSKIYWPQAHNDVIQKILRKARKGTKIKYIVGNHDEGLREFLHFSLALGNIELKNEDVYYSGNKKILVIHGDQFDQVVKYAKWLAKLGDTGYTILLKTNQIVNWVRRRFGFGYWSLSAYIKHRVKSTVNFIGNYERAVGHACTDHKCEGIMTGHIHCPEIKTVNGILYLNSGDWCESLSAIVEDYEGIFHLIQYKDKEFQVIKSSKGI